MPTSDAHLLTLINLLDGRLSAAEGIAVREQLGQNAVMRRRWQVLSKAVGTSASNADAEQIDEFDVETIAAFIDGELSDGEAAGVERALWENDAALREVVATCRASYGAGDDATNGSHLGDVLAEIVEREFPVTASAGFKESQTLHSTASRSQINGARPKSSGVVRNGTAPSVRRPQQQKGVKQRFGPRRMIAAAVAVLLLVSVAIFLVMRGGDQPDDRPIVKQPPSTDGSQPTVDDGGSGNDDTGPAQPDPQDQPQLVDRPDSGNPIVNRPPRPQEPVPVPPQPTPDSPPVVARGKSVQVAWSDVVGIAARRRENSRRWSGLLAPTDNKQLDTAMVVRTLPHGWVRGDIPNGPQVVVAADSELQLEIQQMSAALQQQTTCNMRLLKGRAAVSGLHDGDTVRFEEAGQEWMLNVAVDQTEVGLIQVDTLQRAIVVWKGEVRLDDMTLAAGQTVTWNGRLFTEPMSDATQHTWQQRPKPTLALSPPVIEAINRSDNLLQALTVQNRGSQKNDIRLAATLSFALDATYAVPVAAQSNDETRRLAAIRWLLAANSKEPHTDIVWKKIETSLGSPKSQLALRTWFEAAQSKTRPTQSQLAELSAGLGARQPIFVRQAAIHFLRQITGQRLAGYDPDRPTRQSIDAVRQQLRRGAGNARRRGQ